MSQCIECNVEIDKNCMACDLDLGNNTQMCASCQEMNDIYDHKYQTCDWCNHSYCEDDGNEDDENKCYHITYVRHTGVHINADENIYICSTCLRANILDKDFWYPINADFIRKHLFAHKNVKYAGFVTK